MYTLRFRTAYGRGCGLDVPGSGIQAGFSPSLMLRVSLSLLKQHFYALRCA